MEYTYRLHDFINIKIIQEEIDLKWRYDHYLRSYNKSDSVNKEIKFEYEIKEYKEFKLPSNHFKVGSNYLGFCGGASFPSLEYALEINDYKICEYTNYANRSTALLLQVLLAKQEKSLVHSAGFEVFGRTFLCPAFGGAGKTTLIADLRHEPSFRIFGDDFTIVDSESNIYGFGSDLSVYEYHLSLFPELLGTDVESYILQRKRLDSLKKIKAIDYLDRLRMKILRFIYPKENYKNRWTSPYCKIPVEKVFGKEQRLDKGKINSVYFLSRYSGEELKVEPVGGEEIACEVNGILGVEFKNSLQYLHVLSGFGQFDVSSFEEKQKEVIRKCFSKVECYKVLIPTQVSSLEYTKFMKSLFRNGHTS